MDVLTRIRAGGREIHCGLATTRRERATAQAQRFRVYERRRYYRPGLRTDRDAYDKAAGYFLALLPTETRSGVLLGSARVIPRESRANFRFPAEHAFEFEIPQTLAPLAASDWIEVTRRDSPPIAILARPRPLGERRLGLDVRASASCWAVTNPTDLPAPFGRIASDVPAGSAFAALRMRGLHPQATSALMNPARSRP